MRNYHLSPDAGRWTLRRETDGSLNFLDTKEDGVAAWTQHMQGQPGSLTIHRSNGSVEEERTQPLLVVGE